MQKEKLIAALNQRFYQQVATTFDQTRQSPWAGWGRLLPLLPKKQPLQVLDLACGNGRLYSFLKNSLPNTSIDYVGLDDDQQLLDFATQQFPQVTFKHCDLLTDQNWPLPKQQRFDLIGIFGLTHHLPSNQQIVRLLQNSRQLLTRNGYIVVSNWQFAADQQRFQKNIFDYKKIISNHQINLFDKLKLLCLLSRLRHNEYLLDWQRGKAIRYARHLTAADMQQITQQTGLAIKQDFLADGKSGQLNHYFILSVQYK